ncbi:MAG: hypothetical protein RIQ41_138 [Candidatus Parcubacteria bacterium]|jgi:hypothetical protein
MNGPDKMRNFIGQVEPTQEEDPFQKILEEADWVLIHEGIDRNEKGQFLAPDGSLSHLQNELYWKIAQTQSFKKWFGRSVVTWENGEPKVVYKASLKKYFDVANGVSLSSNSEEWSDSNIGIFFTSYRDRAVEWYRTDYRDRTEGDYFDFEEDAADRKKFLEDNEEQIKVFSAFIKLEKPFVETGYGDLRINDLASINDFHMRSRSRSDAKNKVFFEMLNKHHDGLYIPRSSDFGDEYAVIQRKNIFILPSSIK